MHGNLSVIAFLWCFCCSDELRGLAEACGASSLQDPAMFSFDVDRAQVIIVEGSSSDTGLQHFKSKGVISIRHIIISLGRCMYCKRFNCLFYLFLPHVRTVNRRYDPNRF